MHCRARTHTPESTPSCKLDLASKLLVTRMKPNSLIWAGRWLCTSASMPGRSAPLILKLTTCPTAETPLSVRAARMNCSCTGRERQATSGHSSKDSWLAPVIIPAAQVPLSSKCALKT